jgi:adenosine deaminase
MNNTSPLVDGRARIDEDVIRALPKAEVHVHLEGTFDLVDLLELAKAAGVPLPGPARSLFDISTHYELDIPEITTGGGAAHGAGVGGLSGFLRFLDWQCALVQSPEAAARTAYRFAARQSASGVRYADVIVNPTHWESWHGNEIQLLDALGQGLIEAEQDGLCSANLAVSLLRSQTTSESIELVESLLATKPARVVALSVDGDEKTTGRTGEKFHAAFTLARAGGLRRTVHAGESSGPEGVWDAIDLLHAERIDHGVRSIEDPALIEALVSRGIPLDVCPRSNVSLGIYADWSDHPILDLIAAGVTVTINTDDPAPLGTSLVHEWATASEVFGFDLPALAQFARNSITASFADDDLKRDLLAELDASGATTG